MSERLFGVETTSSICALNMFHEWSDDLSKETTCPEELATTGDAPEGTTLKVPRLVKRFPTEKCSAVGPRQHAPHLGSGCFKHNINR